MAKKILKIASVVSEVAPYSKSGGLADIARSLPKALKRQGHEVVVITPLYFNVIDKEKYNLEKIDENVTIIIDNEHKEKVNFYKGYLMEDLPVYFIENKKYFTTRKNARYGSNDIYESDQPNIRFLLFDLAVLKLLIKLKFEADIIQCHDWHTGLIPYFLKNDFKNSKTLKNTASVFTIHNLVFQMGKNWWQISDKIKDTGHNGLPSINDPKIEGVNFVKRAILNADIINTVSEQYADEILTKSFGEDLHRLLKNRKDGIFGILNGIDYNEYNPEKDPGLYKKFNYQKTHLKQENKNFIQQFYNLPQDSRTPIFCMTSRIAEQKGFDLIQDIADIVFRFDVQFIIMGNGDKKKISDLKKIEKKNSKKLRVVPFEQKMETSLYAGSDFILIPSRFEPCGLTQMKSMRYGCVPIARHVGGFVDTVSSYDPIRKTGNGFVFKAYDSRDMLVAITRAIEIFKRKDEWGDIVHKVMKQSFSWEYPARKYIELFKKAIKHKENKKN